jgi:hypothetical protein
MGFGIKKDVTANVTPSEIVNFDQLTPTTVGVVFSPDTPETTDVLYVSSVDASTWIWNGSAYVTYSAPSTSSTEWYLLGTTIDAGSNKTATIQRSGAIYVNADSYFNDVRVGKGSSNIVTNTVLGRNSGSSITTGGYNTFVGENSGAINTSAIENTFIGGNSGRVNTTGASNTFIGVNSGYSNTTANYNTFIGHSSGHSNTTGTQNVAIGDTSFYSNTTGSYNTTNGFRSLYSNTTGNSNVANGNNAGRFIADGTTGLTNTGNSVFLGADSKALANNQTNQIVIGYNAIGKGSNTVQIGNTSITDTYLQGNITVSNQIKPNVQQVTSNATITANSLTDNYVEVTALAVGVTIANPSGTALNGEIITYSLKDNGTARPIAFGSKFTAFGSALPTTTTVGKVLLISAMYNATSDIWMTVNSLQQ